MIDSASPLEGWSASDVLGTDSGPATGDLFGKLFYLVSSQLANFNQRLAKYGADLTFSNVNAKSLHEQSTFGNRRFDRIEVSSPRALVLMLSTRFPHNHYRSPTS